MNANGKTSQRTILFRQSIDRSNEEWAHFLENGSECETGQRQKRKRWYQGLGRGFGWCRKCGDCQRGNVKEVSTKSTYHQTHIAAKLSTEIRLWDPSHYQTK